MKNTHNPNLVILTETRLSGDRANSVISNLGFEGFIKVDAMGLSRGIWVLWNPHNVAIEPISTSFHKIHLKVQANFQIFLLTALYASPNFSVRKQTRNKLSELSEHINLPWLLMGDFNEINKPQEKFGGRPPNRIKIETFNRLLHKADLIDLGFVDPRYTWTNCRQPEAIIRTRIDRCHANPSWLNIFPEAKVIHLACMTLDHCLILLKTHLHYRRGEKNPLDLSPFG